MKFIGCITILLLLVACGGEAKNGKDSSVRTETKNVVLKTSADLKWRNDKVFLNNEAFSGTLFELNEKGDTLLLACYLNGMQDGLTLKWYANKKPMEERMYLKGKKHGVQLAFWENGYKKLDYVAKDDANEGELKEWNVQGDLIHMGNYINGQEEGTQKLWYDNGKIRANYVIRNGKRYGLLGTKNCRNVSDSIFIVR